MASARAIFSFFLISPFSKGRHRGICFYFSSPKFALTITHKLARGRAAHSIF